MHLGGVRTKKRYRHPPPRTRRLFTALGAKMMIGRQVAMLRRGTSLPGKMAQEGVTAAGGLLIRPSMDCIEDNETTIIILPNL